MGYQVPFYLASAMALFAAFLGFFFLPPLDPESIEREDFKFLEYLTANGFDITQLGEGRLMEELSTDNSSIEREMIVEEDKLA